MTATVRPNSAAEEEFRQYVRWYESESVGLGDRLWGEIQAAIELISTYPSIGEPVRRVSVRRRVRQLPLRHFPFLLVYRESQHHIEIVALAHTSRKPGYWRKRLK